MQAELVKQAVAGDVVALKLLLAESRLELCRYLSRKIPTHLSRLVDADDLTQDAHVEVFRRIADFELRGPDSFTRWVSTIALSRLRNAISWHRAARRGGGRVAITHGLRSRDDSTIELLDTLAGRDLTPSRCVARGEAIDAVQEAIDTLPEQYRQAILLIHIEGQPVREAAASMGRTERAVHGLCRRGMKLLRERLSADSILLSSTG